MFRVEKCLNRLTLPEIQYIQSVGVEDEEEDDSGDKNKVTTYFFPSMVFPQRVEILSITLMCKCKHKEDDEKIIKIAIQDKENKDAEPKDLGEDYYLRHKSDPQKLITTFKFPSAIVMDPEQPFYFYTKNTMESSCLVLAFRNMD
jgi:hypothetical protein